MDGRAEATATMMVGTGDDDEYGRRAEATTTRTVGAGDDDEEDGREAADEADNGNKED